MGEEGGRALEATQLGLLSAVYQHGGGREGLVDSGWPLRLPEHSDGEAKERGRLQAPCV